MRVLLNPRKLSLVLMLLCTTAVARISGQLSASATSEDARISNDFEAKAEQYIRFRENAGAAPKSNKAPAVIVGSVQQLAEKIRVLRAGAKQGEIFTPVITQYFRRQIVASLRGPYGKKILTSLRHAEPVKMELQINQSYPDNVPLQSTPPTLLLNLPTLPEGLEYRILNRRLVLRDAEANIIVDYIPNALPESTK